MVKRSDSMKAVSNQVTSPVFEAARRAAETVSRSNAQLFSGQEKLRNQLLGSHYVAIQEFKKMLPSLHLMEVLEPRNALAGLLEVFERNRKMSTEFFRVPSFAKQLERGIVERQEMMERIQANTTMKQGLAVLSSTQAMSEYEVVLPPNHGTEIVLQVVELKAEVARFRLDVKKGSEAATDEARRDRKQRDKQGRDEARLLWWHLVVGCILSGLMGAVFTAILS